MYLQQTRREQEEILQNFNSPAYRLIVQFCDINDCRKWVLRICFFSRVYGMGFKATGTLSKNGGKAPLVAILSLYNVVIYFTTRITEVLVALLPIQLVASLIGVSMVAHSQQMKLIQEQLDHMMV